MYFVDKAPTTVSEVGGIARNQRYAAPEIGAVFIEMDIVSLPPEVPKARSHRKARSKSNREFTINCLIQLESEDSWTQELLQQALITVSLTGAFVDNGSANGEVDIEDKMEYTVVVGNSGSVRLTSVGKGH